MKSLLCCKTILVDLGLGAFGRLPQLKTGSFSRAFVLIGLFTVLGLGKLLAAVPAITSATTATGQLGVAFSYQIIASNTPTSFGATGLPSGLSVSPTTGLISGTPTAAAASSITLQAINASGTGTKTLTLTINPATPVISSATSASGQVGVAFSYQIAASNTPTSYSATGLPAGLSVSATTGAIAGKPTTAGPYSATINAKNAGGTGSATLSINVLPAIPVISSAATSTGQVGVTFSYQIAASNLPTSLNATGLPAGLTVDTTGGLISGSPTIAGTSTVSLSATNAGGTGTKTLTLTVNPATPVISSATSATGQVGVAFNYQITASNTPTSYSATGLPAGLSVSATTGAISGKPTTTGPYSATINAKNAGGTGSATLSIHVLPATPVISSAATATGQVGVAFNYQIAASNLPTSFNATGLPSGFTVDTTAGLISGSPTTTGTSTVTLSATNAGGTGTKTLTITVNPATPVITSASSATGQVGVAFSYQIAASNTPTSYSATGLPAGLSVSATTGVISGKPTTAGPYSATINAKNAGGTGSATLSINVLPATPVISSTATATAQVGVAFSYQITASNLPTSFNATGLPSGLTVDTIAGLISGTPAVAGVSTVTLSATNAGGTGSKTLTLTVNPATPVINSATSANGQVGITFSYQITASNTPTSYSATGLPAGLSVSATTGTISGKPTTAGTYSATINAKNAGGTGSAALSIAVLPAIPVISSAATASGQTGVAFSYQIVASNAPTSFSATGLPAGLTVSATTGLISGTPITVGTSTVTLSATNAGGTGNKTLTVKITLGKPVITSATAATGQVSVAFNYQITALSSPTSFTATGLPGGLTVNTTTGLISGTPTTVAVSNVTIGATNTVGSGSAILSLTINPPTPVISSPGTGSGQTGATFSYQIAASNNPTSFSATGLPPGLTINTTTGLISGTPTVPGTYTVTIGATNAGGTISTTITLTILATLPYTTDFEAIEGYTLGSLNGQLGWTVGTGVSVVSNQDFAHGAQSVQLAPSTPQAIVGQTFADSLNETIEFFDFYALPVAGTPPGTSSTFTVEESEFAFLLSGSQGVLQSFNGNGAGGGTWTPTPFTISLGADNQAQSWVRLSARLDFTRQLWDLYANGRMVAADIPFISHSTYLSTFQLQGDVVSTSGLDYINAKHDNPLFADTNNNGIDDDWETTHGLSLQTNNRYLSPTGNGVTVLQAYLGGTDPNDFYNGTTPQLVIVSGNNQTAVTGQFNTQPFIISVMNTAGTAPLVNAPVSFTVESGGGQLALTNTGTPALSATINLTTDANGNAQVFYQQPATANISSTILANAGQAQVTFTGSSTGSGTPDDSDNNGLPDAWEIQYFGQIGNNPAADPGGVGRTLLQSYQQSLSPWPVPVVANGLKAWYRADEGITMDANNNVSQWTDVSGNGFHVVQTTSTAQRPSFVAGAANSPAAVAFSGVSALTTPGLVDVLAGNSDITVITVIDPAVTQVNLNSTIVDMSTGGSVESWRLTQQGLGNNQFNLSWSQDAAQSLLGSSPAVQTAGAQLQLLTTVKAGTNSNSYFNGFPIGATTVPGAFFASPQQLVIGNQQNNSAGFAGQIAEVLVYNRALSDMERQQIETALEAKYGMQAVNPDIDPTNGLSISWEMQYFGELGIDPNADPDGDGFTNLQEYQNGTDPTDYYNGLAPTLTIIGGNNQVTLAGQFNAQPLAVSVTNAAGTAPLANAPVTFTVQSGGGQLALTNTGTPALTATLTLTTDANGNATVYYQQPSTANVTSTILLTAGTAQTLLNSTSAAVSDSDGNGLPDAWENQYLGQIANDPTSDPGNVGRTLLQSYQQGLSPWAAPAVANGLQAWYRADVGVIQDVNNNVSQWTDMSGNGFHLLQSLNATQSPSFIASAVNNQPAVVFGGASALTTPGLVDVLTGSSDITVITIMNPAATQTNGNSTIVDMSTGASVESWRLTQQGLGNNQFNLNWSQDTAQSSGGGSTAVQTNSGAMQMLSIVKAGTNASSYLNGAVVGAITVPGAISASPQKLVIGNQNYPYAGFVGQIAEVLVYNRALSDTERQQIETALETKYSIQAGSSGIDPANGLPISWEMQYFGKTGIDPNADPDGDGFTNLQEYQNGTDPTDYYNGVPPTIFTLQDPNGQLPSDGAIDVLVQNSKGLPLPNAPVVFTASADGYLVSATPGGSGSASVKVYANARGIARAYLVPGP